jgi:hypothetical protein
VYLLVVWALLNGNPSADVLAAFQTRAECEKALVAAVERAREVPQIKAFNGVCISTNAKYL